MISASEARQLSNTVGTIHRNERIMEEYNDIAEKINRAAENGHFDLDIIIAYHENVDALQIAGYFVEALGTDGFMRINW